MGLRNHGVQVGTPKEFRLAMGICTVLMILGGLGIAASLVEIF